MTALAPPALLLQMAEELKRGDAVRQHDVDSAGSNALLHQLDGRLSPANHEALQHLVQRLHVLASAVLTKVRGACMLSIETQHVPTPALAKSALSRIRDLVCFARTPSPTRHMLTTNPLRCIE